MRTASTAGLPEDPGQEAIPIARPEPMPTSGVPVSWKADRWTWANRTVTLYNVEDFRYRGYVLRADKITYHEDTEELQAEGHLRVEGGPEDIAITASHGEIRLNMHTARFYDVTGTMGVRSISRTEVYSTPNPLIIRARVLLQTGEGSYRVVDGSMTNCRLPKPDWELVSRKINVSDGTASAKNTYFKLIGIPLFYIPYLRHPVDESGRQSGLLIPVLSNGSSIRGYTVGEQYYWAINRSMDLVLGTEYYSKRGWAPNGDFRYRGRGLDYLTVRGNALFDRGYTLPAQSGPQGQQAVVVNQGGVDVMAEGRRDYSAETRLAGRAEYLSRYVYRLVFNDMYSQAVSSEVESDVALTHAHKGLVSSLSISRLENFASPTLGDEVRLLHLPSVRFDALDHPFGHVYWGLGSSMGHLARSEPGLHAHNDGRVDVYPHISMPLVLGGWSIIPEAALRETLYSNTQIPDLTGTNSGVPTVSHDPLARSDAEARVDLRPPTLERDFTLPRWHRKLRHVVEPELFWNYVGGIGAKARSVLLVDTTDIATNTNEVGYSLTQRFYLQPPNAKPCANDAGHCASTPREWASWQVAQKYYLDPTFGGALIPGRRNVFASTLDLTGVSFLTEPRNLSPLISRMRFEAINNLRIEWDLDYDAKAGRIGADNLYAGYSWGDTTVGLGRALLNAVDEQGSSASTVQNQQINPFLQIGEPTKAGLNLAANGGYDFVHGALQYAGVQAAYNWNCCGLTLGYRRFALGTLRDETQYLYSFTLANFGAVGDIRRANTVFRDPNAIPAY
ncbi:MAG: LPS-assembly protein LptD [Acidobacteriota bacterium]